MTFPTRAECVALDETDPLAPFRDEFVLPEGVIYLDGNSLGALPTRTAAHVQQVVTQEWGQGLIRSWNDAGWFDEPRTLGDRIGSLIGAGPGQVVVCDSTSVNVFKALSAALGPAPRSHRRRGRSGQLPDRPLHDAGRDRGHPLAPAASRPRARRSPTSWTRASRPSYSPRSTTAPAGCTTWPPSPRRCTPPAR